MTKGKITVGIIVVILGLVVLFIPFAGLIWGPILIGVGIAIILLHDSDKKIEERKDIKIKNTKK